MSWPSIAPAAATRRRLCTAALAVASALVLMSPAPGARAQASAPPVRVGSKIDTEGSLLGQLIIQALQAGGIRTENRLQLGTTQIVRSALLAGEIDLYPEYTGNGAFFFGDEKHPAWKNRAAGHARVKSLDAAKNRLAWLDAAPANNTWAIAVRQDLAQQHQLASLADLARYLGAGGRFKLAASAEFIERPDALPAFQQAYGFRLAQPQLLALAGGDTAVTVKAAAEQTRGVNAAMAYGTDGPVSALGLVILDDPKGVQPVYAPAPVVRAEVLQRQPRIAELLAPVFATLDGATLQRLNAQIALEGQDAAQVARAHLMRHALTR